MPQPLFRKVAIERQASPEQLDVLMQITSPRGWLALLGLGAILLGALSWGVLGSISDTVTGQGILSQAGAAQAGGGVEALLFFPAASAGRLREGMTAEIAPLGIERAEYGFLRGHVARVSEYPASSLSMTASLQNENLVQALSRDGSCVEVAVALIPDPASPSGYSWSSSKGPEMKLRTGVTVKASVTVAERRPISLLIPSLKKSVLGIE
jgi:HlyD family secretion protein